ncbi:unnamed protein product [Caenorhabditis auriculariae]|uniref:BHLH domain-containing protein n=1 Tax=Caenorhabditis auriculariae TaxID=2777116 RepID=A0A8S1GUB2_9PELO|nr:unnamed protein product [Caenorhabditis auriculariae]
MDPQLSIGTLLTAARILESKLPQLNVPISGTMPSTTLQDFPNEQMELRELLGKLKVDRRSCNASTSSEPYCTTPPSRKNSKNSRTAHNELEKTRRANLRGCLEKLKTIVPCLADACRNTTLALLTRARDHIKELDDENELLRGEKAAAEEKHAQLLAELERLREEEQSSSPVVASRPESQASSMASARESPVFLEYSPSSKPSHSPRPSISDLMAQGLLPALPICFPRPSVYPYLDLNSSGAFLPINLSV